MDSKRNQKFRTNIKSRRCIGFVGGMSTTTDNGKPSFSPPHLLFLRLFLPSTSERSSGSRFVGLDSDRERISTQIKERKVWIYTVACGHCSASRQPACLKHLCHRTSRQNLWLKQIQRALCAHSL